ncbi:MAG: protein kinase [Lachnospiraceae bacterium]|nr:protein kinase [Lachnospiraceae bacterium]
MINPGTVLGNRYEISELIGTGGMANVYKAIDSKLNRNVAIKVLKDEYSSNKNFVSKFKAEAQAVAGLMHPNIVNVYDVGDENGIYYFVMELVEGITLKKYIEKKIRLSVKEAISIAIQVSMGIEAAHNNGIIHRDIKPQNIIISRDGKVKVADFGIARAATSDTITTHAMGSVHYTSPEQARGGYSDAKSDIYSIGITLFEMVTGRVPFDGETTVSIAIKHIQEEMPSPKIYVPEIPVSVEQIIFKCTQKHPDMRYSNMAELISDLKKSLINPDDNFVVINDMASNAGTRTITDEDRQEIRNNGQNIDKANYGRAQYEEAMGGQNQYDQGPSYQGGQGYKQAGYPPYVEGQPYGVQEGADNRYKGQPYEGQNPQYEANQPYGNPQYDQNKQYGGQQMKGYQNQAYGGDYQAAGARGPALDIDDDEDDDIMDFLFSPKMDGEKSRNRQPSREREKEYSPERRKSGKKKKRSSGRKNALEDTADLRKSTSGGMKTEKVMSLLMVIAAIVVAVIAIIAVGKVFGMFSSSSDKKELEEGMVYVPNVVGMTIDEASQVLLESGLKATASYAESNVYDKDIISGQDPVQDTVVEEGSTLELVVSSGLVAKEATPSLDIGPGSAGNMVAVPDVVGLIKAEAKVKLENEGFVVEFEETKDSNYEMGEVVKQSPMGAESAASGSKVLLYINSEAASEEAEEGEIEVPDLVGKDEATAKQLLSDAKLTYETVSEEANDGVTKGIVLSQTVEAGSKVKEGTTVNFTISRGPATYACNLNITAPADYLAGTEATIVLVNPAGIELGRYTTTAFPYSLVQGAIAGSDSGVITISYQNLEGQVNTTQPIAVTFTREQ